MTHPETEPTDENLLRRVAEGDGAAFALFYDRHSPLLFGLSLKILLDETEAQDALQESFVAIWERAGAYDAALGRPLGWAVTVARNKAIDLLRRRQRQSAALTEAGVEAEIGSETAAADEAPPVARERAGAVRSALDRLPREQRLALELAFFKGLTQNEIAETLGAPLGTIKARIRRGMLALRDALEGNL